MPRCFLSYSSKDRVMVERLASDLRIRHYEVWIDFSAITPGYEWEAEITKALAQCEVCLVVVTPDSIMSEWVKRETALARAAKKQVIPLVMRDVPLPDGLAQLGMGDLQAIHFVRYGYDASFQQLLETLPKAVLDSGGVAAGLKALVIEDSPPQQLAIQQVLHSLGLATSVADNFGIALERIRTDKYDLVTLDMQLNEMDKGGEDGMLLLDELGLYQRDVPVIIISGLDWTEEQVRDFILEYRVANYVKKQFKANDLRTRVKKALKL